MRGCVLLALVGLCAMTVSIEAARKSRDLETAETCPKKDHLLKDRKCRKSCTTKDDCTGKRKECLCDDVCGMSCINPKTKCPRPEALTNGKIRKGSMRFGRKLKYKCGKGFSLVGTAIRVCRGDKTWSSEAPKCVKEKPSSFKSDIQKEDSRTIGCPDPESVPNADHTGEKASFYPIYSTLVYQCRDGYIVEGESREAYCTGDGQWSGPYINCVEACKFPGNLTNGVVVGESSLLSAYGSAIHYECKPGYKLQGSPKLNCQRGGRWEGTKPKCVPKFTDKCPPLEQPDHGSMNEYQHSYNLGDSVTFSCDLGYTLLGGEPTRECLPSLTWSGTNVYCEVIKCPVPSPVANGKVIGTDRTYRSQIIYTCNPGSNLDGPSSRATCNADGTWSAPPPRCLLSCALPDIPGSHRLLYNGQEFEETVIAHSLEIGVECASYLSPTHETPMMCRNGRWENVPQCIQEGCKSDPPTVKDARAQFYGTNHGDIVKYKCNAGFTRMGLEQIKCMNGKWEGAIPYCRPTHCPHRGTLENGYVLLVGMIGKFRYTSSVRTINHGDMIEYYCDFGYNLDAPVSAATCISGSWSPERQPKCFKGKYGTYSGGSSKLKI